MLASVMHETELSSETEDKNDSCEYSNTLESSTSNETESTVEATVPASQMDISRNGLFFSTPRVSKLIYSVQ
jgi:hypothetical protein